MGMTGVEPFEPTVHSLEPTRYASGGFWPVSIETRKEVIGMWTVKVKDGDYGRLKNGEYGTTDLVSEFEDLESALGEFIAEVESAKSDAAYGEKTQPVTLTFKAKAKKGKK